MGLKLLEMHIEVWIQTSNLQLLTWASHEIRLRFFLNWDNILTMMFCLQWASIIVT
jgi:hypothetical protein